MSLSTIAFCKKGNCDRVSFTEPAAALRNQGRRFLLPDAQWFTAGITCTFHPGPQRLEQIVLLFCHFSGKKPVVEAWPMDWPHDQNRFYAAAGSFHLDDCSLPCYTVLATVIQLKRERW